MDETHIWRREHEGGFVIGASTRSPWGWPIAAFYCFWWYVTGTHVYRKYILREGWLPNLHTVAIFGALFGLCLFIAGTLIAGRQEVRVDGDEAVLFTGFGKIGTREKFRLSDVTDVRMEAELIKDELHEQIVIHADRPIELGGIDSDEVREALLAALRDELLPHRAT